MSGGRLVVLDRLGRDVKVFPLEEGLATIGSDPVCDIRIILPTVSPHHATVVVHTNQTVVRSVSAAPTLLNGAPVSVAALRHRDTLRVGGRALRWEYTRRRAHPPAPAASPALFAGAGAAAGGRGARGGAGAARRRTQPHAGAVLVPEHRASMPGSSSGKQIAIVQPQRRETNVQNVTTPATTSAGAGRSKRSTLSRSSRCPLRVSLLRGAGGGNVTKIQAPARIDHTKQAAIMLMTGHTSKGKQTPSKAGFVPKRPSPVRRTPKTPKAPKTPKSPKTSQSTRKVSKSVIGVTPKRASVHSSRNSEVNKTASILEITDSDAARSATRRSTRNTTYKSPKLSSPKKSSLKDPAKKPNRKTESIKFDLSNLQDGGQERPSDVMIVGTPDTTSEDDMTLHYTDTSPSPRKSIHSRSSKILEKSLGTTYTRSPMQSEISAVASDASTPRKSVRGSLIVQKALENTDSDSWRYSRRSTKTMSEQSFNTVTSARKTRTSSPRTSRNLESYSIVDLVSLNSNESESTLYNSMDSNSASLKFDTPQGGRNTRCYNLAGSSTPYSKSNISESSIQSPKESKRLSKKDSDVLFVEEGAGDGGSPGSGSRTPILNIQRLLSQSASIRGKRKSLPTASNSSKKLKLGVKSRSLSAPTRRSQRARKSSPPQNSQLTQDEEIVTPKSAVKLVQEAVKNKHSTAKKPTSKRSIIDDLNESDLVKQLFNSPVKRKLSRSMTEFSRKELFEDDVAASLKHKRNTTALTGRTPDLSLLNDTEAFTPEVFVSPLSSPGRSPNLTGIRRLFRKDTPENDLRDVRGVKELLRTPRNRKSVKNDLTNVSGVKKIFAKSPRNRLSDVRVKEMFAASPSNDLRQVGGLRSLFQGEEGGAPKNTLQDVRGVKSLFRGSPRNDLTEVRGVRDLYRQQEKNNLSDLSGVEELFYDPSALDSTFDLLVGKPRVRSYKKAKSFSKVTKRSKPTRNAKSLQHSIGSITNNVEEWLESELKKRTNNKPTPKKSVIKSNLTRELEKLSTDTVAGSTPLRASRVRNDTSTAHQSPAVPQKSASELYSAHKLPIKKRRVLHSTPVKGGAAVANDTIGARELGRVSPIQRLEPDHDSLEPKPLTRRGKVIEEPTVEPAEPSRRTRRKPVPSPAADRQTNIKKRRSSIVIKKKPPALTPKPSSKVEKVKNSPIKTKSTRQKRQVEAKIATPKVTRAKKTFITKPSPQLKQRSTRNTKKETTVQVDEVKMRRSRKITNNAENDKKIEKIEPLPEQGVRKRGRKTEAVTDEVMQKPVKRGRRNVTENDTKEVEVSTKSRRIAAKSETSDKSKANKKTKEVIETKHKENEAPSKRSRRTQQKTQEVEEIVDNKKPKGRGAKTNNIAVEKKQVNSKEKNKINENKSVDKVVPRTRRGAKVKDTSEDNEQIELKSKQKRGAEKTSVENKDGGKTRNAVKEAQVKPTRGRKVTIVEEQAVPAVRRGRKRKADAIEPPPAVAGVEEKKRRATRAVTQTETVQRTTSRSRRR